MLESLYNKVAGRKASLYLKETSTRVFFVDTAKPFDSKASSGGICRSSLLNQKQFGMVSTTKGRSGHITRYLHIISRNHPNTLLLINLQKRKTCKPLQQRLLDLILGF